MHHLSKAITHPLALLAVTLWIALAPISVAYADVTRVVVKSSGPMGVFRERQYIWVTATMEGTVERGGGERGQYRVLIVLMYPDRTPNGFGLVDIVNSASFRAYKDGEAPGASGVCITSVISFSAIICGAKALPTSPCSGPGW
jgi:hypothetical protein